MNQFSTKAKTLEWVSSFVKLSQVPPLLFFQVKQWKNSQESILRSIESKFGSISLIIRSSALGEDHPNQSMAGVFKSCLNVNGRIQNDIILAVESVIASYSGNPHDQILIQPMIPNISVSGVITTHVLDDGAPYYVINYDDESGRTDTITGGTGINKTVLIHRDAEESMILSERVKKWKALAEELEYICDNVPLDIEFAQTYQGQLYLFQVRRISVEKNWNRLTTQRIKDAKKHIAHFIIERSRPKKNIFGDRTFLGKMTDWNPAEIIGTSPRPLAVSLYRKLIMDNVWSFARSKMGYYYPRNEKLMVIIGGQPFVDVRSSFNSLLPANINKSIAHELTNAYLDRLDKHIELHDNVEFEILHTILDLNFDQTFKNRYPGLMKPTQLNKFREKLLNLTKSCLNLGNRSTLEQALRKVDSLEKIQLEQRQGKWYNKKTFNRLIMVADLLDECKHLGTIPFAILARHAFIAEKLLRSAVERSAITPDRVAILKQSTTTIMGQMTEDFKATKAGKMKESACLQKYGHLRPGTYDILSLRYDERQGLFSSVPSDDIFVGNENPAPFYWTDGESKNLNTLLNENKLDGISPNHLLKYVQTAIVGREYAKFIFSKNLSDLLELISIWGDEIGLSRDDLSYISIETILGEIHKPTLGNREKYFRSQSNQGRSEMEITRSLHLSYLIRDIQDIYVVPLHRSAPNFITSRHIEGEPVLLSARMREFPNLFGKIVCIENADPGFDWIFTRNIIGLITKFGGSNSHMAIRCAEIGLPASIGCGEQTFQRLSSASRIELNCADRIVRPIYA